MGWHTRIAVALALVGMASGAVACSEDESPFDVSTPLPSGPTVEANAALTNVRPAPWRTATPGEGGRDVVVDFLSGPDPGCGQLARVDVDESPARVVITIHLGDDPTRPGANSVCSSVGRPKRTVVTLREPLDGRPLVDGTGGR